MLINEDERNFMRADKNKSHKFYRRSKTFEKKSFSANSWAYNIYAHSVINDHQFLFKNQKKVTR